MVEVYVEVNLYIYDVVICMEMLEYVFDLFFVIQFCVKLVKFGGYVFFLILNCNVKFYLFVIVGVEKLLKIVLEGMYDYNKFICFFEFLKMVDYIVL